MAALLAGTYFVAKYALGTTRNTNGRRRSQGRTARGASLHLTPASDPHAWESIFASSGTSLDDLLKLAVRELPNHLAVCPLIAIEAPDIASEGSEAETTTDVPTTDSAAARTPQDGDNADSAEAAAVPTAEPSEATAPAMSEETVGANSEAGQEAATPQQDSSGISPESTLTKYLWPSEQFQRLLRVRNAEKSVKIVPLRLSSQSRDGKFILSLLKRQRERAAQSATMQPQGPEIAAPLMLLWAGEAMSLLPCAGRDAGAVMAQLELVKRKCKEAAKKLGPEAYRLQMTQRFRALSDMRAHHALQDLVRRGVISAADVIVDDPQNPEHNADAFHDQWAYGTPAAVAGATAAAEIDPVEEVQRFLLKQEQERALQESLAADQAKAARKREEERKRAEEEAEAAEAEEAEQAAEIWDKMNKEHILERFAEEESSSSDSDNVKLLKLSLVYPSTGRRQQCKLRDSTPLERLGEYAYAHATAEEGITHKHLDNNAISFHISFPKPHRFELSSEDRTKSLADLNIRSGTLLRIVLSDEFDSS